MAGNNDILHRLDTPDSVLDLLSQAIYDALTRLEPVQHAIPYARSASDQLRVVVDSGVSMATYSYWASAGSSAVYYGTGAPTAMDAREQAEFQSIQNFNQVRQGRWTF